MMSQFHSPSWNISPIVRFASLGVRGPSTMLLREFPLTQLSIQNLSLEFYPTLQHIPLVNIRNPFLTAVQ